MYLGARAVDGDDEMGVQIVPPDDARIAERIAAIVGGIAVGACAMYAGMMAMR